MSKPVGDTGRSKEQAQLRNQTATMTARRTSLSDDDGYDGVQMTDLPATQQRSSLPLCLSPPRSIGDLWEHHLWEAADAAAAANGGSSAPASAAAAAAAATVAHEALPKGVPKGKRLRQDVETPSAPAKEHRSEQGRGVAGRVWDAVRPLFSVLNSDDGWMYDLFPDLDPDPRICSCDSCSGRICVPVTFRSEDATGVKHPQQSGTFFEYRRGLTQRDGSAGPAATCSTCITALRRTKLFGPNGTECKGKPHTVQLEQLLGPSGFCCPLCNAQLFNFNGTIFHRRAVVDHSRVGDGFVRGLICFECNFKMPHGLDGNDKLEQGKHFLDKRPYVLLDSIKYRCAFAPQAVLAARVDALRELQRRLQTDEVLDKVKELRALAPGCAPDTCADVDLLDRRLKQERNAIIAQEQFNLVARHRSPLLRGPAAAGQLHIGVETALFLALHMLAYTSKNVTTSAVPVNKDGAKKEVPEENKVQQLFRDIDLARLRAICGVDARGAADVDALMEVLAKRAGAECRELAEALRSGEVTFPHMDRKVSGADRVVDLSKKLRACVRAVLLGNLTEYTKVTVNGKYSCFFDDDQCKAYRINPQQAYLLEIVWLGACPISGVSIFDSGRGRNAALEHNHWYDGSVSSFVHETVNFSYIAGIFDPLYTFRQFTYCLDAVLRNYKRFKRDELVAICDNVERSVKTLTVQLDRIIKALEQRATPRTPAPLEELATKFAAVGAAFNTAINGVLGALCRRDPDVFSDADVFWLFDPLPRLQAALNRAVDEYNRKLPVGETPLAPLTFMVMGSLISGTGARGSDIDLKVLTKEQCDKYGTRVELGRNCAGEEIVVYFPKTATIRQLADKDLGSLIRRGCDGLGATEEDAAQKDAAADDDDDVEEKNMPTDEVLEDPARLRALEKEKLKALEAALKDDAKDDALRRFIKHFVTEIATTVLSGSAVEVMRRTSLKHGCIVFNVMDGTEVNIHFGLDKGSRHAALLADAVRKVLAGRGPGAVDDVYMLPWLRRVLRELGLDTAAQKVCMPWRGYTVTTAAPFFIVMLLWLTDKQRLMRQLARCVYGYGAAKHFSPLFDKIDLLKDLTPVVAERVHAVLECFGKRARTAADAATLLRDLLNDPRQLSCQARRFPAIEELAEGETRHRAAMAEQLDMYNVCFALAKMLTAGACDVWRSFLAMREARELPSLAQQSTFFGRAQRNLLGLFGAAALPTRDEQEECLGRARANLGYFFNAAASIAAAAVEAVAADADNLGAPWRRIQGAFVVEFLGAEKGYCVTLDGSKCPGIVFKMLVSAKIELEPKCEWHLDVIELSVRGESFTLYRRAAFRLRGPAPVLPREAFGTNGGGHYTATYSFVPPTSKRLTPDEQQAQLLLGFLCKDVPAAGDNGEASDSTAELLRLLLQHCTTTSGGNSSDCKTVAQWLAAISRGTKTDENRCKALLDALDAASDKEESGKKKGPLRLPDGVECGRRSTNGVKITGWIEVVASSVFVPGNRTDAAAYVIHLWPPSVDRPTSKRPPVQELTAAEQQQQWWAERFREHKHANGVKLGRDGRGSGIIACIEAIDQLRGPGEFLASDVAGVDVNRSNATIAFLCGLVKVGKKAFEPTTPTIWRLPDDAEGNPRFRQFRCWTKLERFVNRLHFTVRVVSPTKAFVNSGWWSSAGEMLS
jgi:hypothetical protein